MKTTKIKPDHYTRMLNKGGRDYTRELVRQRDGRICQMCGKSWEFGMRRFDVHHLYECGSKSKAYDRVKDIDDMITYCHKCHLGLESVTRKMRERTGQFKHSKEASQHPFYKKQQIQLK